MPSNQGFPVVFEHKFTGRHFSYHLNSKTMRRYWGQMCEMPGFFFRTTHFVNKNRVFTLNLNRFAS